MTTTIDTLATYEAIAAAGIDDRGARAISKAIAESASTYREDLATKNDLAKVETELKVEIAAVKELVASTQNKTIIWMFGMLVTFAGVIIGVLKLT